MCPSMSTPRTSRTFRDSFPTSRPVGVCVRVCVSVCVGTFSLPSGRPSPLGEGGMHARDSRDSGQVVSALGCAESGRGFSASALRISQPQMCRSCRFNKYERERERATRKRDYQRTGRAPQFPFCPGFRSMFFCFFLLSSFHSFSSSIFPSEMFGTVT